MFFHSGWNPVAAVDQLVDGCSRRPQPWSQPIRYMAPPMVPVRFGRGAVEAVGNQVGGRRPAPYEPAAPSTTSLVLDAPGLDAQLFVEGDVSPPARRGRSGRPAALISWRMPSFWRFFTWRAVASVEECFTLWQVRRRPPGARAGRTGRPCRRGPRPEKARTGITRVHRELSDRPRLQVSCHASGPAIGVDDREGPEAGRMGVRNRRALRELTPRRPYQPAAASGHRRSPPRRLAPASTPRSWSTIARRGGRNSGRTSPNPPCGLYGPGGKQMRSDS